MLRLPERAPKIDRIQSLYGPCCRRLSPDASLDRFRTPGEALTVSQSTGSDRRFAPSWAYALADKPRLLNQRIAALDCPNIVRNGRLDNLRFKPVQRVTLSIDIFHVFGSNLAHSSK